jgi:adenylosuccinate synthase
VRHPIVVGMQYGDEGKGKITDVLARQTEWVIRFNGGNNAGHTLWLNGKKLVTHSVPSGVRYSHAKNFIGAGCVIDPLALTKEIDELKGAGVSLTPENFKIDYRAHVTLPLHVALDAAREGGSHGLGTTKRGIGPTYSSKTDRIGIRVGDIVEGKAFDKVRFLCQNYNSYLKALGSQESSESQNLAAVESALETFRSFVSRDPHPFYEIAKKTKCVLEGAQGILLDIDHGSYPFVTSSSTLPAFAAVGAPFPLTGLGAVIGVCKAYVTRVGLGPFDTELKNDVGERIRKTGAEFGATTGRPRRIGWLNLDELRQAVKISDCTHLVLTKGDVLNGEKKLGLHMNGKLEMVDGWSECVEKQGSQNLSPAFDKYIQIIEKFIGIPVVAAGTGTDREDLVWRNFKAEQFWS